MKNNKAGFSLIELLVVVVIIGIVAAIAVAGLLASRRSANEGSAVSSLRILHQAEMTYASSYGAGEYAGDVGAGTLTTFNVFTSLKLVDDVLGSGSKSGYNFVGARVPSSPTTAAQFYLSAIPLTSDPLMRTGNHRLGISTDGVMRMDLTIGTQYTSVPEVIAAPSMGE